MMVKAEPVCRWLELLTMTKRPLEVRSGTTATPAVEWIRMVFIEENATVSCFVMTVFSLHLVCVGV